MSAKFPFPATCLEKEWTRKISCRATNNWIVLVAWWSTKYFFAPTFAIFQKSCGEEEEGENRRSQSVVLFKQTQNRFVRNLNDSFELKLETRLHTLTNKAIPRCKIWNNHKTPFLNKEVSCNKRNSKLRNAHFIKIGMLLTMLKCGV